MFIITCRHRIELVRPSFRMLLINNFINRQKNCLMIVMAACTGKLEQFSWWLFVSEAVMWRSWIHIIFAWKYTNIPVLKCKIFSHHMKKNFIRKILNICVLAPDTTTKHATAYTWLVRKCCNKGKINGMIYLGYLHELTSKFDLLLILFSKFALTWYSQLSNFSCKKKALN